MIKHQRRIATNFIFLRRFYRRASAIRAAWRRRMADQERGMGFGAGWASGVQSFAGRRQAPSWRAAEARDGRATVLERPTSAKHRHQVRRLAKPDFAQAGPSLLSPHAATCGGYFRRLRACCAQPPASVAGSPPKCLRKAISNAVPFAFCNWCRSLSMAMNFGMRPKSVFRKP